MENRRVSFLMKTFHEHKSDQLEHWVDNPTDQPTAKLFPITGGKTGSKTPWLTDLPKGTLFIAAAKKGFTTCLDEYRIMEKEEANGENFSLLRQNKKEGDKDISDWEWHDDDLFSHEYKLKKVLNG